MLSAPAHSHSHTRSRSHNRDTHDPARGDTARCSPEREGLVGRSIMTAMSTSSPELGLTQSWTTIKDFNDSSHGLWKWAAVQMLVCLRGTHREAEQPLQPSLSRTGVASCIAVKASQDLAIV